MARIVGVDLPVNKKIYMDLTYIQGIGLYLSNKILTKLDIDLDIKVKDLSEHQIVLIRNEFKIIL